MLLSDLELSRRLERAEGHAGIEFAMARRKLYPDSGAEWLECGGAYAVFDGIDSPITQTFGLGLFEELSPYSLDTIERFFFDRGASVNHEVSPLAGIAALKLLCARNYRPIGISNVLYQPLERITHRGRGQIRVRTVGREELSLWTDISTRGWTHEHPELLDFFRQFAKISSAPQTCVYFLAELEGNPGAAGLLSIYEGIALFGGATTVPEMRHRGLQSALLQARLSYAFENGCDLASMAAEAGSRSQHNAERSGFRIAYTRTKWQLRACQ